ncbi:sialate O-acetylesterase [Ferruginibacter sp. SUN106]|uniref:sialate O-acetylesterase n=1 Tax=Ferruginibacter sp. SUN106 TaxID=2978348 RepID=UPI003D367E2D
MIRIGKIFFLQMLLQVSVKASAQLSVPKIIGNDMVLQSKQPVPIWGNAKAGDEVVVTFGKQQKKIIADNNGSWKIMLDAMPPSAVPGKLYIKTPTSTIVLENIVVGEVWLCSGQSNMEYTMRKNSKVTMPDSIKDWPVNELETAHNKSIRIFLVDRKKMKPDSTHSGWDIAEDSALRSFSAVGYFFAKKMYEELHVPIGIIASSIPGSRIEPWMPEEAFKALPFFRDQPDSTHKIDGEPGKFYQTMIAPLAPFALKGFLWYQGESNCFLGERLQYAYKMKALINQWRKIWNNNTLPFYYVQIAPYAYSKQKGKVSYTEESEPEFWEAQALALKIPHTAMIATTDLNFDLDNLHPHFKWVIGKRLALCALANDYAKKAIVAMGPVYDKMKVAGNKIILDFKYTGTGLASNDGQPLNNFTIAAADGKFVPAKAVIKNNRVEVSTESIQHPVAVRFGWNEANHSNLYNKDGLPALPFRTDNPLTIKFK